jgi:uncharacterized protein (DUF362 family)
MAHFVKPGDKVVVKPNIGWDRSPEQAANTHPLVVQALVMQALEAGAQRVLVFDRTCNEQRRCYANSGIEQAVRAIKDRRAVIEHVDQRKFVPVDITKGQSLTRWDLYRDALECDCYINVPVAKHHGLSRLTLGLKNSMGVIGGNRGRLHFDLAQKLADLATVISPKLTVIDATRILLRNGPQGGNLNDVRRLDTLIASADPVAADAYATTLFDLSPDAVDSTVAAHAMGLGEMDLNRIRVLTRLMSRKAPLLSKSAWRRISQALFLVFFLFLFIKTDYSGVDELTWAVNLLFRIDPSSPLQPCWQPKPWSFSCCRPWSPCS